MIFATKSDRTFFRGPTSEPLDDEVVLGLKNGISDSTSHAHSQNSYSWNRERRRRKEPARFREELFVLSAYFREARRRRRAVEGWTLGGRGHYCLGHWEGKEKAGGVRRSTLLHLTSGSRSCCRKGFEANIAVPVLALLGTRQVRSRALQ